MKMRMMWRTAPVNAMHVARTTRERRGFALPMAILVIAFLTVSIAAAYTATSSELTTNMAQRGESKAYMVAQAGLENFSRMGRMRLEQHLETPPHLRTR